MVSDSAFRDLYHPRLFWPVCKTGAQRRIRTGINQMVVAPLEWRLLKRWQHGTPLGAWIERDGLPRRSVHALYKSALTIDVQPLALNRFIRFNNKWRRRALSNRFIWDGDWDLQVKPFQETFQYRFIRDLWENRNDLTRSRRYTELTQMIRRGRPYRSYHKGVYLDTEAKVLQYLKIYLCFMRQIQQQGYHASLAPDAIGIGIDRRGAFVKISKGNHRLAMAQIVGLKKIPVLVGCVHRTWWERAKKAWGPHLQNKPPDLMNMLITAR